jgi:LuxR family maltose regulon positive regulatory protein
MDHVLTTKLHIPPVRPALVSRPHLLAELQAGLHRKLTLISAPAGFGKTTVIREWAAGCAYPVAWLSLDASDSDPTRFLAYVIAALNRAAGGESPLVSSVLGMLQAPQRPPTDAILTALINDIAASSERTILVLDDYHAIEASPVDAALTFLLDHLPPHLHLVIATRFDPHLPLARLRAQGQLTELRAADLRFTPAEAARFLTEGMGLSLAAEDIAALEARTEGWITGLHLAALSLQGQKDVSRRIASFSGSHRFVLDYLIEEVLEQQPEPVQAFLLHTAVLDRLTGALCDALTDQANGQATLEWLDHANLFIIALDDERRWYRYHHLFADLLRQRLQQAHPEYVPALHRRASTWYAQHGFTDAAIEHALLAQDDTAAARLIETVAEATWGRGEHTRLRRWLDGLPAEAVFARADLCILHAWLLFASGQPEAAERRLQAAESTPEMRLQGRVAVIRAFLASFWDDVPGMIQHACHALACLPAEDVTWRATAAIALGDAYGLTGEIDAAYQARLEAVRASTAAGNVYMSLIAHIKLAITLRQQGHVQQTIAMCQQQFQFAQERGMAHTGTAGCFLAICGEALAEQNDLAEALQQVRNGVALAERGGDVVTLVWCFLCLLRVCFSCGDMAGAEATIAKIEKLNRELHVPPWVMPVLAAWQVRVWLAQKKLDEATQWMTSQGPDLTSLPTYVDAFAHIACARLLLAQGRVAEGTAVLDRLREAAEAWGQTTRMMEILLLHALALQSGGDSDGAMTPLAHALTLAETGGFARIFVDEGSPMARLLYEAVTRGIEGAYPRRLLATFPVVETPQHEQSSTPDPDPTADLIEPLSDRELEVMHCIAKGLTNQDIATRLCLSPHTVKAHTRSIYSKLDVHNRTQAVARARALGLLSSC